MAANHCSEKGATPGSRRAQVTRLLSEIEKKLKAKKAQRCPIISGCFSWSASWKTTNRRGRSLLLG